MSDAKREGEKEKVYNEGGEGACSTREQAKKEKDEDGEYLRELRGRWLTFVALMTRFESIKHSHYGWVDMRQLESVLPQEMSIEIASLRNSLDLAGFGQVEWTEQSRRLLDERLDAAVWWHGMSKELKRRFASALEVEYWRVRKEATKPDNAEVRVHTLECARICARLQEIGEVLTDEKCFEESDDEGDDFVEGRGVTRREIWNWEGEHDDRIFGHLVR